MRKWFSVLITLSLVAKLLPLSYAANPSSRQAPNQVAVSSTRGNPTQRLSFEQNIATYNNGGLILGGYLGGNQDALRYHTSPDATPAIPHFKAPISTSQNAANAENLLIRNPHAPVRASSSHTSPATRRYPLVPQINPYVQQETAGTSAPAGMSTAWAPPHFTTPVRNVHSEAKGENLLIDNPYLKERRDDSGTPSVSTTVPVAQVNPYVRKTTGSAKQATGGMPADAAGAPRPSNSQVEKLGPVDQQSRNRRNLRFPDQPPIESAPLEKPSPVVRPIGPTVKPPAEAQSPAQAPATSNPADPPAASPPTELPPELRERYQPAPDENLLNEGHFRPVPADGGNAPSGDTPQPNNGGNVKPPEPLLPVPPTPPNPPSTVPAEVVPRSSESRPDDRPANRSTGNDKEGASDSDLVDPTKDPHYEVFAKSQFPSARECAVCHKQIFEEWSVSSHAYAAISPMFQRFEQTINTLTQGTIGYFCLRCHSPVGTTISHPRWKSIWESIPAATEGVTCIVCHRVWQNYGKVNGERRIEPGDIFSPVTGSGYGYTLQEILQKKEHYKVKTSPDDKGPGQRIHTKIVHFEQISKSEFCVSCHQVVVYPGIALEVVWAQYRASPACKQGISCQDCHMGSVPGQPLGYDAAPVAVVGDREIDPGRKHSNHTFYGPGYSIAHPGIFPFRAKQEEDWTPWEWQQFDYRAGWGTDRFEEAVDDGRIKMAFPKVWENADDRADAWELLEQNLAKLSHKTELRRQLMEYNSKVEGPFFHRPPTVGKAMKFRYLIRNLNSGHNMPSGSLGAQPQLWLNVALTGPDGNHLWESGYVDANGDLADLHSLEVAAGRIRRDRQLINLQTKFLIANVNGPDREFFLPVAVDIDQLPFIRPAGLPVTVLNHPPFIRMEAHSVPPLGQRVARYHVPANIINRPGTYRLSVRMRSRAEPIYFMKFCRATPEMERNMNERMLNFHEDTFEFVVH